MMILWFKYNHQQPSSRLQRSRRSRLPLAARRLGATAARGHRPERAAALRAVAVVAVVAVVARGTLRENMRKSWKS